LVVSVAGSHANATRGGQIGHSSHLILNTGRPLPREQLATIAQHLTGLTAPGLRDDPALTVVRIVAGSQHNAWFAAGAALPSAQPLAQLSITITAGTNTGQEKADWQHAAWELLRATCGDSVLPNYVSVVELPGTDWDTTACPRSTPSRATGRESGQRRTSHWPVSATAAYIHWTPRPWPQWEIPVSLNCRVRTDGTRHRTVSRHGPPNKPRLPPHFPS
jgi:hypothetical protein